MPAIDLISVDLPAPLSPTSAITSPRCTSRSTSLNASTDPKDFEMPRSSRTGVSSAIDEEFLTQSGRPPRGGPPSLSLGYFQYFFYVAVEVLLFFWEPGGVIFVPVDVLKANRRVHTSGALLRPV